MAQLPPEIQADSYLLRVEQAIRDGDEGRARAEIDKIILLQKEQELNLSEEFLFRYAKAAAVVDRPEQALESVTKYLIVAGRDSQHYVEALELMNLMQDAVAGRKEVQDVSPEPSAPPQSIQGSNEAVPATSGSADEQNEDETLRGATTAPAGCELWNTDEYFKSASLEDVKACLEAGVDVAARTQDGHTPLHMAAQYNGDPAVVQALLAHGADLNAKVAKDEHTPLHEAAMSNPNPDVLQALLTAGADRMERDGNGASLLCWAAGNENPAIVEILLQAGMDPQTSDKRGYTPLHWGAAYNENPEVLKVLLTAGAELMARSKCGSTPLHVTADPEVMKALLEMGADPMARNEYQETPLHVTAKSNENPALIQTLLGGGANLEAQDNVGQTPLHEAAQHNDPAMVEALIAAGANLKARDEYGNMPLHYAAEYNDNPEVIQTLLAAGADLEARGKDGATPLLVAAEENSNPGVVKALLAAGADPMAARGEYEMSALHLAASMNRNPEVCKALLAAGADLEARDELARTPLVAAVGQTWHFDNLLVIKTLLAAGANPMARRKFGETPLHDASETDYPEVIEALLAAGADPVARDKFGSTPLHIFALVNKNPAVIEALLVGGADLSARDRDEGTPLHNAAEYTDNPQVIDVLLAAGANPLARDKDGKTPWDLAQANEKLKGSDAYWRLNEARFEASGSGSRRTPATRPSTDRNTTVSSAGGPCLIPGYPSPPGGVANLGLPWCPATVGFQARAFALQAAGAQCAIATGISSTPEQIQARRQEIKITCERLAALGVPNCRCP